MKIFPWICALILLAGCSDGGPAKTATPAVVAPLNQPLPFTVDFFSEWLKSHGHTDVVVDENGVGVNSNPTRLKASLYGSKKHANGDFVVETEFRVRLSSGREIVEFLVGTGDTEDKAIKDSMANFTLSTFHVVYKGFINDDDPHMTSKPVEINGQQRQLIQGDLFTRSDAQTKDLDLNPMSEKIEAALANLKLGQDPHWIKVVYGQIKGQPSIVSATVDNDEVPALSAVMKDLDWPRHPGFYMSKQFIVIR